MSHPTSDQSGRRAAIDPRAVTVRAAGPDDDRFLLEVFASARTAEMETLPPDEGLRRAFVEGQFAAQRAHYRAHFPLAEDCVVFVEGRPAGRLYVSRSAGEVRVLDVILLPEYRNAGAGTVLMGGLMAEAARAGVPVRLYVETFNPARRLFERLGFASGAESGFHVLLEWWATGGVLHAG